MPLVLRFSFTTIRPLSSRSTSPHRRRYCTSCSSVRWPRHHWFHIRSYATPAGGCHSSSPTLKMLRTPRRAFSFDVNFAIGSTTSTCSATSRRRPSVMRPMLQSSSVALRSNPRQARICCRERQVEHPCVKEKERRLATYPAPPSRAVATTRRPGFVPTPSLARKLRDPCRSALET